VDELPDISPKFLTGTTDGDADGEKFLPYLRDEKTLARHWAVPGTPGLEHRIGGLEKEDGTGDVSYDPANHQKMTNLRAEKVERVALDIPELEVHGEPEGELLVLGWGSTEGAIIGAVQRAQKRGLSVSRAHLRYLNPFPRNLDAVLAKFEQVLVPEMNMGQLAMLLRARSLKNIQSFPKVQGLPFMRQEIYDKICEVLKVDREAETPTPTQAETPAEQEADLEVQDVH